MHIRLPLFLSLLGSLATLADIAPAQDFSATGPTLLDSVHPRATVRMRWSISNWDNKTIAAGLHGIYVSTDDKITTADRLIRTVSTPSMGKLQYIRETTWTVPADIQRGYFWVGLIADHLRRVKESDEGNNVSRPTKVFFYGRPDLSIPYMTQTTTKYARGGRFPFRVTVRNAGGYVANPCEIELRLSYDSGINVADPVVARLPVRALLPGASTTVNGSFRLPANYRLGSFYLGYWVDRGRAVMLENYRTNNIRAYRATCYAKGNFWTFGAGCRGVNGVPRQYARSSSTDPYPGTTVTYSMTLGARGTAGLLGIGLSRTQWNGLPLPRSMAVFGAPGCTLYTSLDLLVPMRTSVYGAASLSFKLPSSLPPGSRYYTQFFSGDTVNALGFAFSEVVETTLGSVR